MVSLETPTPSALRGRLTKQAYVKKLRVPRRTTALLEFGQNRLETHDCRRLQQPPLA